MQPADDDDPVITVSEGDADLVIDDEEDTHPDTPVAKLSSGAHRIPIPPVGSGEYAMDERSVIQDPPIHVLPDIPVPLVAKVKGAFEHRRVCTPDEMVATYQSERPTPIVGLGDPDLAVPVKVPRRSLTPMDHALAFNMQAIQAEFEAAKNMEFVIPGHTRGRLEEMTSTELMTRATCMIASAQHRSAFGKEALRAINHGSHEQLIEIVIRYVNEQPSSKR